MADFTLADNSLHVVLVTKEGPKEFMTKDEIREYIQTHMSDVKVVSDGNSCIEEIPELKKELYGPPKEVDMEKLFGILSGKLNTVNKVYGLED